jgi:hypothetical protein
MHTMDLRTRVTVYCGEKRYGILREVVVDPNDGHITDLVIEPEAHPATVRIVPVSLVTRVGVNKVHLGLNAQQIDRYPAYRQPPAKPKWVNPLEKSGTPPVEDPSGDQPRPADTFLPVDWAGTPNGTSPTPALGLATSTAPIEGMGATTFVPGTPVLCADGQLVTVERVCVDPVSRRRAYLTLHHRRARCYRLIPVQRTKPGVDGVIITGEAWNKLPLYLPRNDNEIYEEICAVLMAQVTASGDRKGLLSATVQSGFVTLLGTVKTPELLDGVVALVNAIPGVIHLYTDVAVNL